MSDDVTLASLTAVYRDLGRRKAEYLRREEDFYTVAKAALSVIDDHGIQDERVESLRWFLASIEDDRSFRVKHG